VHLLFLDESGQLDQPGLFALGGLAIRDSRWPELRVLWHDTLRAHAWPLEREIKWHGIRTGSVTCFVVLLDLRAGPETFPPEEFDYFRSPEDVYATGLMFLAERFQHLLAVEGDLGLIVVDSRFRDEDSRLRRFYDDLTKEGTPYMQLERLVEGLFLGPSHYSIGLQCADLVVAITAAAERGAGQARGYLKKLLPRFARHPGTGELEGVGLKRFPDEVRRPRERTRLF